MPYAPDEVRFLSLVAGQAALAIDDALNFEASRIAQTALERKNDSLKALLEINNTIVANLELRDLLKSVSASLRLSCNVMESVSRFQIPKVASYTYIPSIFPAAKASFAKTLPLSWTIFA